jgi:hypothetical protein
LRKALDARGGREAAARIQSFYAKGTLEVPWLKGSPCEVFAARPDRFRITAELKTVEKHKGGHYDAGTDGQIAWEAQPGETCKRLEGETLKQRRQEARFFAELDEPEDCQSATCLGETTFDGRKCYAVRLVKKSGEQTTHFYDVKTLRLAGAVQAGLIGNTTMWTKASFGDYKPFDGFQFATRMEYASQHNSAVLHIDSLKINQVGDSVFKMPTEVRAQSLSRER